MMMKAKGIEVDPKAKPDEKLSAPFPKPPPKPPALKPSDMILKEAAEWDEKNKKQQILPTVE